MAYQTPLASNIPAFLLKPEKKREYPTYEQEKSEEIPPEEKEH
jgi:hypothetical protein